MSPKPGKLWRVRGWGKFQKYMEDPRTRLFAALACDQRIAILKLLREGEKCTCDLAPKLRVDISVVSRHLAILKSVGLIISRKEGVNKYYSVADERIFSILDAALEVLKETAERHRYIFTRF